MKAEETLKILQSINLTKPVEEMVVITDEPKIPGYLCFPSDEAKKVWRTEEVFGQGFHQKRTQAKIRAIGECLERLCLYNPKERGVVARYGDHNNQCDPALFFCYSEEQTPFQDDARRELRGSVYQWWPVMNVLTGEKELIPAQLVFLSNVFDEEQAIRKERISTGAAFGPQKNGYAIRAGLMEVIERDACIGTYLTRRKLQKIVDLPCDLEELVAYLQRYQLEPHLFDATTDLEVPTITVVTLDHSGIGAAVNVGSRSALTYKAAIRGALLESIHCRRTSRVMKALNVSETAIPEEDEIFSMDQRFYYWHPVERIADLDGWLKNPRTVKYAELTKKKRTIKGILEEMRRRGYHVFVADMTLPVIKEKGFEAVKVVIPELHPLYLDERAKALFSVHYGSIPDDKTLKPHPLT
jgi:thiazole/oxazole-forming peptide maturase SagD family component